MDANMKQDFSTMHHAKQSGVNSNCEKKEAPISHFCLRISKLVLIALLIRTNNLRK